MSNRSVAVYNPGVDKRGERELLGHVSLHKAMKNIIRGKYRVVKESEDTIGDYHVPLEVELQRYLYARWKYENKGEVPFSKRGVLRRDNYVCCYCGGYGDTVDHVLPKWEGNAATWNNSVAACFPCNNKKGGRSPEQAGMKRLYQPHTPTFAEAFKWTRAGRTTDDVTSRRK